MKVKIKTQLSPSKRIAGPSLFPQITDGRKEGFIRKFIKVIIDDINFKFRGLRTEDRQKWEDYKRFCELTRGKQ